MSALLVRTVIPQVPPALVTVVGEIDIASAPSLCGHLMLLPDCSTILDLSGVQLLSAAGLNALVDLHDRLTRAEACLVLAAAPLSVRRVLAITRLDDTLLLADTVDDAIHLVDHPDPPTPTATGVHAPVVRGAPPPPPTDVSTLAYLAAERRGRPTPGPASTAFVTAESTSRPPRALPLRSSARHRGAHRPATPKPPYNNPYLGGGA
jgi:anti-anti-sigma factor